MAPRMFALVLAAASIWRSSVALTGRERGPRPVEVTAPAAASVENRTAALVAASGRLEAQGHSLDHLLETETSRSAELRRQLASVASELEALATARRLLVSHVSETKVVQDRLQLLDRHFAETGTAAVAVESSRVSGVTADLSQTFADLSSKLANVESQIASKEALREGANTTLTELTALMEGQEESKLDVLAKISKIDGLLQMQGYMKQEYQELMDSLGPRGGPFAGAGLAAEPATRDDPPSAMQELRNQLLPAARSNAAKADADRRRIR